MTNKRKKVEKNEDDCEDWCFVCKDGGELIICEHKSCLKSYHGSCVKVNAKSRFICGWHKCDDCNRPSDFQCYVCPISVCGRCVKSADFVRVKGKKGFCRNCLKLTLLIEEGKDVDSDGEKVDFDNRDTFETLFKEYWLIINEEEKLTLDELKLAKAKLKPIKDSDSDDDDDNDNDDDDDEVDVFESYFEEEEEIEEIEEIDLTKKVKRSTPKPSKKKVNKKVKRVRKEVEEKSNKEEFNGWGSTRIIDFLKHLNKDTTNPLSQRDLETIIKRYSTDNNLLQKKKTIECDDWLKSIFKRKTIKLNRIYDSLETHLAENQVSSSDDEDEIECDSEEKDLDVDDEKLVVRKNKKKKSVDNIIEENEPVRSRFAAIVPDNIRLVYLRRSLVQKFENEPDTFESRVIGSFVRVKDNSNGCFSRKFQLMQVTGAKKCSVGENETFVLQAVDTDISIDSLSDDDFSNEECQELRNKVKSGLLKKLEFVELEAKAKLLHKDIVTHWIPRELTLLKHRIDQANEKGWRRELHDYLEKREMLQNPEKRSKLLEKPRDVIPDIEEVEPVEDDNNKDDKESPKSILTHTSSAKFKDTSEEIMQQAPGSEKIEMAKQLEKFFTSLDKKDKYKQASAAVKSSTQLFDSIDEKSNIDNEDLKDTESSQWYVTRSNGDTVGPVSLSVLKNWIQDKAASESKIYKTGQTKEQAKPLTAVLRLAFPKK
ncbi:zinc finger CCCH domain-containing protein 44-like [Rutidosis leptorrhynchoides]|uniref:zinc finger CCCH domain-containing protein 44-like n=1 Tax=Rutidosis leptorrhynchoides TaxID=125765 RepID=UPI003A99FDAB